MDLDARRSNLSVVRTDRLAIVEGLSLDPAKAC
jgi:hypothetical protein